MIWWASLTVIHVTVSLILPLLLILFPVDDLKQIDQEHINEGILASCCLLVYLNDETMQSEWCVKEWECARDAGTSILSARLV